MPLTTGAPMAPDDFEFVSTLVRRAAAIVLEPGKEYLVESRLRPLADRNGFGTLDSLVTELRRQPTGPLKDLVVEAMTTNETSFFRDVHPFEALRNEVLPAAIQANSGSKKLRLWCGASSTGQEPYSIGLVVREHFPELADWDVRLLATDISPEVLARTKAGSYTQLEVNRGLPASLLVKWFTQAAGKWQVASGLRDMLDVKELNLIGRWPAMGPFDVVFLRNVLIYFDVADKRTVLERIKASMAPGAALFLGAAESTIGVVDGFERRSHGRSSWYVRS